MSYERPTPQEEEIGAAIVDAALKVHRALGPGLLEKVYEICLAHELKKKGFEVSRQVSLPIEYDGITFDEGLRMDILVQDLVIVEIKAVTQVNPIWQAQIISHLRLTGRRLGFLINFNVFRIKNGIQRIIV